MQKAIVTVTFAIVLAAIVSLAAGGVKMKITSSSFQEGGDIPSKFSRDGQNINPALRIEGTPSNAKSLLLIMDDPDAPVGLFTHWLVWNIDPKTTDIAEKSVPKGAVQGTNDYPTLGYGGPQPPSGEHRYFFKAYALDTVLPLSRGSTRDALEREMSGHVLDSAALMGKYAH